MVFVSTKDKASCLVEHMLRSESSTLALLFKLVPHMTAKVILKCEDHLEISSTPLNNKNLWFSVAFFVKAYYLKYSYLTPSMKETVAWHLKYQFLHYVWLLLLLYQILLTMCHSKNVSWWDLKTLPSKKSLKI